MKAANSTCLRCNFIFPRYMMHQCKYTEHSGYSWSENSRRDYYRKKTGWLCEPCYKITIEKEIKFWVISATIIIAIFLIILLK